MADGNMTLMSAISNECVVYTWKTRLPVSSEQAQHSIHGRGWINTELVHPTFRQKSGTVGM